MDGMSSRVLELYGKLIDSETFGRSIHQVSEENYGFAGALFIRYLINNVLPVKHKLKGDYTEIRDELKARFESLGIGDAGAHLDNIAVIALADKYASVSVFGEDEMKAAEGAIKLGLSILQNTKALEKSDTVERAWDFTTGWIAANRKRFCQDSIPCYGAIEPGKAFIISNELNDALIKAGFVYTKCIKGFRERGYISVFEDANGVQRSQFQKRVQGINVRTICANVDVSQITSVEEDFDRGFSGIPPLTGAHLPV